ncbi:DNA/RNA non-specific endonuclease [Roseospira goensis]|uniref:DNA/RNA endonuclease G (NUC1) n=1 Tax=Roseospira goensis TaxID=391922 RepID=A0A7W6S2T9_9PROT|nr:DNA/RNA non-specific endonuclease [Roseospira goensis]MBB4287856.1 DNA/RNA endonuclease G (NUC1) [Roseospira goensis]
MAGYNPRFLCDPRTWDGAADEPLPESERRLVVDLPRFSPALEASILRTPALTGEVVAEYVNYSVVMNRQPHRRSAVVAALNIDQTQVRDVRRSDRWRVDSRIGAAHQLDNDYYYDNPWDRGHLARRASAAWGRSNAAAGRASDETFYYSNATLQHKHYNQDEWLALEDWVLALDRLADGRVSSFSGPIYDSFVRSIEPEGRPLATVPSAFFKAGLRTRITESSW